MTWGLALSGGGLLGAAHIGVLEALSTLCFEPPIVAGTSAGGLVAGAVAAGVDIATLRAFGEKVADHPLDYFTPNVLKLAFELDPHDPLPPATGLIDPQHFLKGLSGLFPQGVHTVEDLDLPCALSAVDLKSMKATLFSSRPLVREPKGTWQKTFRSEILSALHATMAMPGVFTAARVGSHLYVDGGVADTLPVDLAWALGADRVLAVNVAPTGPLPSRTGIETILSRSESYATDTLSKLRTPPGVELFTLTPDTLGVPFLGFKDYGKLVQAGARAVHQKRAEIAALIEG